MEKEDILKERDRIIRQIKEFVPLFAPFFDLDITVAEYSHRLYQFKVHPLHLKRQTLVKNKIGSILKKLWGEDYANQLKVDFGDKLAFNIVDHHMVLNHTLLIGSNVISNVDKFFKKEKQPAIIVISSGDVPPNNYFSKSGFQLKNKQVPLFSVSERETSSNFLPKREFNVVERLKITKRWHTFNKLEQEFLTALDARINSFDFSRCQNYNDQISVIVKQTWPWLFENKLRSTLPELLYITQEELTAECLIDLLKEDNFLSQTLFNPELRQKVLENFRGIVVAWREDQQKGTHFFWRKHPNKPTSLRMYVQDGQLVPVNPRFTCLSVALEKNTIIDLLKGREIYPSLFMIFGVLNFYAGVKPLTGYGSTVYLELIRQAWLKSLKDTEFKEDSEAIKSVDATGFIGGIPIFFGREEDKIKTLFAADLFYQGGAKEDYLKKIFNMKFNELVSVAAPDLYDYFSQKYITEEKKIKKQINLDDLANITFDYL